MADLNLMQEFLRNFLLSSTAKFQAGGGWPPSCSFFLVELIRCENSNQHYILVSVSFIEDAEKKYTREFKKKGFRGVRD